MQLSYTAAFLGGVLTLLSPCSAMLLPAFFAYAFNSPGRLLRRTAVFYAGLCATLIPLGILAASVGAFFGQHRLLLVNLGGLLLIVLGLLLLFEVRLPGLSRAQTAQGTSAAAVFSLGAIYGLAGVCAGPLLGATLTFAALSASVFEGALVLAVFACGMTMPLLLLSLLWEKVPQLRNLIRPRPVRLGPLQTTVSNLIGSLLTIAVGILMLATAGTSALPGFLPAADQAFLEGRALAIGNALQWWVLPLGVLLCLTGYIVLRHRARARVVPRRNAAINDSTSVATDNELEK